MPCIISVACLLAFAALLACLRSLEACLTSLLPRRTFLSYPLCPPPLQRYNVDGQGSIELDEFREALQLESDPVLVKGFMAYAQGSMTNL